jgi:hypothetical protein
MSGGGGSGKSGGSSSMLGMFTGSFFEGMSNIKNTEAQKNYLRDLEDSFNMDTFFQQRIGDRKLRLLEQDQKQYAGNMEAKLAQSGISFSGSPIDVFQSNEVEMAQERKAVSLDTDVRVNESRKKASQARTQRYDIQDNETMDYVGGFLGGGAKGYQQWGGNS